MVSAVPEGVKDVLPASAHLAPNRGHRGDGRAWPSATAAGGNSHGVTRRSRRREARREAILQVAAPLFVRQGFAATSLDDVATALGLTRPAIYHYFPDKNEILLEIVERGFDHLTRSARRIAREPGAALDKLERIFRLHLERVAADPQAMFLVSAEAAQLSASARAVLRRRRRSYEAVLRSLFEEAAGQGDVAASADSRLLVKAMVSLANWVYAWYDPRGTYHYRDVADFFWALLRGGAASAHLETAAAAIDSRRVTTRGTP